MKISSLIRNKITRREEKTRLAEVAKIISSIPTGVIEIVVSEFYAAEERDIIHEFFNIGKRDLCCEQRYIQIHYTPERFESFEIYVNVLSIKILDFCLGLRKSN